MRPRLLHSGIAVTVAAGFSLVIFLSAQLDAQTPGPTLAEAQKALALAQAAAVKMGVPLTCAVVDSRRDLVAAFRMDKAHFITPDMARGKAMVSAIYGQPSGDVAIAGSPAFDKTNDANQKRLIPVMGAFPISRNNQVIGAIGCANGTAQQDADAAKAGLAAF